MHERVWFGCLMVLWAAAARAQTSPYNTSFPATENPISQGGVWLNGGADGLDWGNVQTDGTHAFGVSLPTVYGDPTAVLKGTWSANQTVQAVVKMGAEPTSCCSEVELRLRTTVAPHDIRGYEILFSITTNTYVQIVRWNGPLANSGNTNNGFTYLGAVNGPGLHDGDVVTATIVGNTLTAYLNGAQMVQATDTGQGGIGPWTSGHPGVGFYDSADNNWVSFGFSSFTATDDSATLDAGPDAGPDAGQASADSGIGVDAGGGIADAGGDAGPDAGAEGGADGGTGPGAGVTSGCGCGSAGGAAMVWALAALCSARASGRRRQLLL